ncbi:hypothetical protein J4234_01340 [Candidatus Woesearchaeota archaeon]|nr:hypothetical protein [Candidatus Woesearchaeota archaeon]
MNNLITKGKNLCKNKSGEKLGFGLIVVVFSIVISLFAFVSENNETTGFAVLEGNENNAVQYNMEIIPSNLIEFNKIKSLSTLAPGNYFIDDDGIVYWIDDESRPAIAIVKSHDETYENKLIYIDDEGRIGYVLESIG